MYSGVIYVINFPKSNFKIEKGMHWKRYVMYYYISYINTKPILINDIIYCAYENIKYNFMLIVCLCSNCISYLRHNITCSKESMFMRVV